LNEVNEEDWSFFFRGFPKQKKKQIFKNRNKGDNHVEMGKENVNENETGTR
jgi:hypothetical protein